MKRPAGKKDNTEMLHGAIKLNVNGVPVTIEVPVPANDVKPQTMLSVLQHLTDSCVELSVQKVEKDGKKVSCSKGCDACCHQLVPVSKVEAHNISKLVRNLPAMKKQRVIKRFEKANRKLSELGWSSKMSNGSGLNADDRHRLAMK